MQANETFSPSALQLFKLRYTLYINYIIFGASAILTNLIILLVVFTDKHLRTKSAVICGLAGGNLFNGVHALGYGIYRMPLLLAGTLDKPGNIWACLATTLPFCILLGYAIPATVQFVTGLERLVAISAFNWYRIHWSSKKTWYTVGMVYVSVICSWIIPVLYQILVVDKERKVTRECSSTATIAPYMAPLILYIIITGSAAVICLLIAVIIGRKRTRNLAPVTSEATNQDIARFKTQFRFCKMMLVVALCELFFVVTPNTFLVIGTTYPSIVTATISIYGTVVYCVNSTSNIFIYLGMNKKFRKVAFEKFRLWCTCKCFNDNNVSPF